MINAMINRLPSFFELGKNGIFQGLTRISYVAAGGTGGCAPPDENVDNNLPPLPTDIPIRVGVSSPQHDETFSKSKESNFSSRIARCGHIGREGQDTAW